MSTESKLPICDMTNRSACSSPFAKYSDDMMNVIRLGKQYPIEEWNDEVPENDVFTSTRADIIVSTRISLSEEFSL